MSNGASAVIRKDDLAGFQPWEMASFDATPRTVEMPSDKIVLPTIEQISAIEEQARQEGYAAGHAEGLAAGREQAEQEAARLRALADGFTGELRQADETISQQILDLSLDLARAVLKSALAVRPELVIPVVREAVRYLPAMHQPALLFLNPADAALVRERIGDALTKTGWQLTEEAALEPGGCRIETANNQIDASLPTRWQRMAAALGKQSDWLAD
jgi:flagellar assembly protein FliH